MKTIYNRMKGITMRMLTLFILFVGMLTGSITQAVEPTALADAQVMSMSRDLGLSQEQEVKSLTIVSEHLTQMLEKLNTAGNDPRSTRDMIRSIEKEAKKQIVDLLTEEQRAAFKQAKYKLLPSPRILELNERLDLTMTQVEQIELVLNEYRPEKDKSKRESENAPKQPRKEMEKHGKERDAKILEILTDEQKEIFQDMKKKRKPRNQPPDQNGRKP
ncbi:MAG: hypothetical protein GY841_16895 [FCB group bacterium]|nr:hypothetical protein [FCB group bacterium]